MLEQQLAGVGEDDAAVDAIKQANASCSSRRLIC
jgi:hypothetical protein